MNIINNDNLNNYFQLNKKEILDNLTEKYINIDKILNSN